jgi:hypothetical protein
MISLILSELQNALNLTKVASNCVGLAVRNKQRKWILPELAKDWANGLAFFARNGRSSIAPFNSNRARTVYKTFTVPMQLTVVAKERPEAIETFLLSGFSKITNYSGARFGINASSVRIELIGIEEGDAIWQSVSEREKPIEFAAIRAEFNIIVVGAPTCFANFFCDAVGNRIDVITTEDGVPITTENDQLIEP